MGFISACRDDDEILSLQCSASALATPVAAAPEVAMSQAGFEECMDDVARRVAAEAGRSPSEYQAAAAVDLQQVLNQRDELNERVRLLEATSAKLLEQREAATRMVEAWRRTADEAVSPAKHDALRRAHRRLQEEFDALVNENARGKEWAKRCCWASDEDDECCACSGPLEVEGGDVWGRAFLLRVRGVVQQAPSSRLL